MRDNYNLMEEAQRNIDETGISTEHASPKIILYSMLKESNPQDVIPERSANVTIIIRANAVGI